MRTVPRAPWVPPVSTSRGVPGCRTGTPGSGRFGPHGTGDAPVTGRDGMWTAPLKSGSFGKSLAGSLAPPPRPGSGSEPMGVFGGVPLPFHSARPPPRNQAAGPDSPPVTHASTEGESKNVLFGHEARMHVAPLIPFQFDVLA